MSEFSILGEPYHNASQNWHMADETNASLCLNWQSEQYHVGPNSCTLGIHCLLTLSVGKDAFDP